MDLYGTWELWSVGVFVSTPPPPDKVMYVRRPSSYKGWLGEASNYEHGSIYWTWAMVKCNALTALGVGEYLVGPPPVYWVVHACYHLPTRETIFNVRIFTGVLQMGDYSRHYMAWQHLAWVGVFARAPLPPPDWVLHVRAFIGLRGPDTEMPILTIMTFSKVNFKHIYLKLLLMITSSDLCSRTQLAMSISPSGY